MSTTTDEIKIDLDDIDAKKAAAAAKDAKKEPATAAIGADEVKIDAKSTLTPEEGLEKLKKQLADEQVARSAADKLAREASEGEARAKAEAQTSQLDLVTSAIGTLTQQNDALEVRYAEAMSAQDFAGAAKAQREMSTNAAKLVRLEEGKVNLEKAPKPIPRAPADPVERFASQLTPRSAAWVREHPEFVRDGAKNRQMLAAHELAIARGEVADTDGYFASIEDTLRLTARPDPKLADGDSPILSDAAKATSTRTAAPAGAPVSRSGNGGGSRPNVVRLTAEQREIAKLNGMTDEEYAREVVALQKEGRLN